MQFKRIELSFVDFNNIYYRNTRRLIYGKTNRYVLNIFNQHKNRKFMFEKIYKYKVLQYRTYACTKGIKPLCVERMSLKIMTSLRRSINVNSSWNKKEWQWFAKKKVNSLLIHSIFYIIMNWNQDNSMNKIIQNHKENVFVWSSDQ